MIAHRNSPGPSRGRFHVLKSGPMEQVQLQAAKGRHRAGETFASEFNSNAPRSRRLHRSGAPSPWAAAPARRSDHWPRRGAARTGRWGRPHNCAPPGRSVACAMKNRLAWLRKQLRTFLANVTCFFTDPRKSAGLNACGGRGLAPSTMRTATMLAAWTSIASFICW